ncbi:MAG: histidine kinase dimerization/phospho-acceptor domain-containing protein [Ginsengibacter sp.]
MAQAAKIFELEHALAYANGIVNTVREPLVVLYPKLTILFANKSFYSTFNTNKKDTIGRRLYEIGNRQFEIPLLQKLLEKILIKRKSFNDFEIENNFESIGHKILLLNARKLILEGEDDQMILLAIEDITTRRLWENKITGEKDTLAENKRLQDLYQQKVDFITIASHELKTPATVLKACAQLLETEFQSAGNTRAAEMLVKMDTQIDNLTQLVDKLLYTTGIKDGKLYTINSLSFNHPII